MGDQHGHGQQAANQGEGGEQAKEAACVGGAQIAIQLEGHALEDISDRHTKDQGGRKPSHKKGPVPRRTPGLRGTLGPVLESYRTQDQRRQDSEHGQVEPGKAHRINEGPGREDGATPEDEPDLVAFPGRPDGVDHHPPLAIIPRHKGQKGGDAKVKTVSERKADQQDAHQAPPDDPQGLIVERDMHDFYPYSAGTRVTGVARRYSGWSWWA